MNQLLYQEELQQLRDLQLKVEELIKSYKAKKWDQKRAGEAATGVCAALSRLKQNQAMAAVLNRCEDDRSRDWSVIGLTPAQAC